MSDRERATVVMLRGSTENRLRQAMAQGLVRQEIQQDVEYALEEAARAQETAQQLYDQNCALNQRNIALLQQSEAMRRSNEEMQQRMADMQRECSAALRAYHSNNSRTRKRRDNMAFWLAIAGGFLLMVVAAVLGAIIYNAVFKV